MTKEEIRTIVHSAVVQHLIYHKQIIGGSDRVSVIVDEIAEALYSSPPVQPKEQIIRPPLETIETEVIDNLLAEFKRQGINTDNWDGDEGWEKAIVDGVKNLLYEKQEQIKHLSEAEEIVEWMQNEYGNSYTIIEDSESHNYFASLIGVSREQLSPLDVVALFKSSTAI